MAESSNLSEPMALADGESDTRWLLDQVYRSAFHGPMDANTMLAARVRLLDGVGLMLSGRRMVPPNASGVARQQFGQGKIVAGEQDGLSTVGAAFLGAWFVHASDFDDTYKPSLLHPGVLVVPTVVALCQELALDLDFCVRLTAAGYDLGATLAAMGGGGRMHANGWHATTVVGAVVVAALAGIARGERHETIATAMSIAACTAGGNLESVVEGATAKQVLPALSVANGFWCLALASTGVTAPTSGLDGWFGMSQLFSGSPPRRGPALTMAVTRGAVVSTMSKFYGACHHIHSYVDAGRELLEELGWPDPAAIAAVEADVVDQQVAIVCDPRPERDDPADLYAARFSLSFCLATLATARRFDDGVLLAALGDRDTVALAQRVSFTASPVADFPARMPGSVRVVLQDGRSAAATFDGAQQRPMDEVFLDQLTDKFATNAASDLGETAARELARSWLAGTLAPGDLVAAALTERIHNE